VGDQPTVALYHIVKTQDNINQRTDICMHQTGIEPATSMNWPSALHSYMSKLCNYIYGYLQNSCLWWQYCDAEVRKLGTKQHLSMILLEMWR